MEDVGNLDVKLEVTLCIIHNGRGEQFFYIKIEPLIIIRYDDYSVPN
jgi:hypothetical protein